MYSTADKSSFDEVPRYIEEARGYEPGVPLFLIRNKIDLEVLEESIVSQEQENDQYLGSTKFKTRMRVSAKTGEGIEDLVKRLVKVLWQRGSAERRSALQLTGSHKPSSKSGCAKC